MVAMGWTWDELMATPADIVQRCSIYMSVKGAIETNTDLTFPEGEE